MYFMKLTDDKYAYKQYIVEIGNIVFVEDMGDCRLIHLKMEDGEIRKMTVKENIDTLYNLIKNAENAKKHGC